MGRLATFDSSRVMCPVNPGSMNPAVEWVSSPSRPERALALQPTRKIVRQPDRLVRRPQHELARMQDERVVALGLDLRRQLVLLLLGSMWV